MLEDCRRQGIKFIPLAVESLGGWHELAVREIKKLAAALARQSGQEERSKVSLGAETVNLPDEGQWGSFCEQNSKQYSTKH